MSSVRDLLALGPEVRWRDLTAFSFGSQRGLTVSDQIPKILTYYIPAPQPENFRVRLVYHDGLPPMYFMYNSPSHRTSMVEFSFSEYRGSFFLEDISVVLTVAGRLLWFDSSLSIYRSLFLPPCGV